MRASPSSPRPSSRGPQVARPISSARHPGSSREPRARRGAARAGQTLRRWLELDEETFDGLFYCASVTRCYPGRTTGRGDRTPTPAEQRLCSTWRTEELRLLRPTLVITVGALAARTIVGATTLTECVGKSYLADDAVVIPLPHPSGASAWLNDPVNRGRLGKALTHARREIARLDE